jgi:hypothetical protein
LEKLDGTLCIVYFDVFENNWCVATRSVPEADLLMDNGLFTFRTLFEKAVKETTGFTFKAFTDDLPPEYTYCFELTTPYNRIVVDYKNCSITLLAVRDLTTLQELPPDELEVHIGGAPIVQAHAYTSVQELVDWVSSLNPMEHEGVVVRDSNFNRIKVKNAAYVAYNKVRDALSTSERNCVELILAEKDDDVVPMLPEEIVKNLQKIKLGVQWVIKEHDLIFQVVMGEWKQMPTPDKKHFALSVQGLSSARKGKIWTAPLFQMFDGKVSNMKDFIAKNRKDGTWGNSFLDKFLEIAKNNLV